MANRDEAQNAGALPPALYVVATPIGNVEDMTPRAARVLACADVIAAEDTRVTRALLGSLGIKPRGRIVSNHKFSEMKRMEALLQELRGGKSVALASDAGTPCVSDPGSVITAAAAREGIDVVAVCGASAVAAALCVSGIECGAFAFYGFFPRKKAEAARLLAALGSSGSLPVSVFFESPMRILGTAALIASTHPGSRLCVCNDLTKRYERVYRGAPQDVLRELEGNPSHTKGEYTFVLDMRAVAPFASMNGAAGSTPHTPLPEASTPDGLVADGADACGDRDIGQLSLEAQIVDYMVKYGISSKEAVAALHKSEARPKTTKKEWYSAAVRLKRLAGGPMAARDG